VAKSLVAKNTHALRRRGLTSAQKVLATSVQRWHKVAGIYAKTHGDERGRLLEQSLIWSERSFTYGCMFLFGVKPLDWQARIWENHKRTRLSIARLMNGGGKTTGKALRRLYAGFFRSFAPPLWGQYRMFQFAPQEAQALETKVKIDEILAGRAREQMYIDKATGETKIRRCFAERWIKREKINGHEGFSFFDGGATLEFVPTAYMGMGKDGTDPMWIDLDEARHEDHLTYLVTRMWLPRFLRVAGHLDIDYTPLDASPELEALLEMAKVSKFWSTFVADQSLRELNPTIRKEDEDLVRETLSSLAPEAIEQVLGGKAIQPAGAKFSMGSVKSMFTGVTTPPDIKQLDGLRARIEGRCPKCEARTDGHPEEHLVVGALDPASSATDGDAIVYEVWDLDAPSGSIEVVYIYEVLRTGEPDGPETIGKVAEHACAVAREIRGPFGIDGKSALGHAVQDEMVRIDPDVELVVVRWDTREEKDEDLDKVKSLIEGRHLSSPFHHRMKIQLLGYVREDRKIAQDYVMVMAVAAHVAWPFLPDYITTAAERAETAKNNEESTPYDGGAQWAPDTDFGIGMPGDYWKSSAEMGVEPFYDPALDVNLQPKKVSAIPKLVAVTRRGEVQRGVHRGA
jgi:hypothetical protein